MVGYLGIMIIDIVFRRTIKKKKNVIMACGLAENRGKRWMVDKGWLYFAGRMEDEG